jgi:ribosomal subunit interface protein
MRLELTGRHLDISTGLRNLVTRKLAKVRRVLNDTGVSAAVIVTTEKVNNVVELSLHARGERFLHAVAKAESWETAMNDAVAKILHQFEKVKNKRQERKRRGPAARSVKTPRRVRTAAAAEKSAPAPDRLAAPAAAAKTPAARRSRKT